MSRTLDAGNWKRLRDLQLSLGPVGATVKLDSGSGADDLIALVPEVEQAIQRRHGIRHVADQGLQVGHWFTVTGALMSYGVPGHDIGGVLFVGEQDARFMLCGSAKYLLDRKVAETPYGKWGYSASQLRWLRDILRQVAGAELEGDDQDLPRPASASFDRLRRRDYYYDEVREVLDSGIEPLTSVARCLEIGETDRGRMIFGTPLYVTFHVPD
jgi:hypothetical protein